MAPATSRTTTAAAASSSRRTRQYHHPRHEYYYDNVDPQQQQHPQQQQRQQSHQQNRPHRRSTSTNSSKPRGGKKSNNSGGGGANTGIEGSYETVTKAFFRDFQTQHLTFIELIEGIPDAELKIFVTASAEIRAQRRYDELKAKGQEASYEEILENVKGRDFIDQNREVSPLRKADDAILLDNSNLTIAEQKEWLKKQFEFAIGGVDKLTEAWQGLK